MNETTQHQYLPINALYLGDCLTFLRSLPDQSVDLILSSPPYNLGKEYESRKALDLYLTEQRKVLKECARLLKSSGSIFWQVGAFSQSGSLIPLDIRFFPILESLGLYPRNRIVWIRQHGLHSRNKFSCRHETILWFTKSDQYTFNLDPIRVPQKYKNKKHYRGAKKGEFSCHPDGKNPGDIWLFRNVKHNHEEQTIHPCQFPEDLVARIILSTTNEGNIVLDPYMGSGTVAVVAQNHNRYYMGSEIDAHYYKVAQRRLLGIPDQDNYFPNLKTLRSYVEKTGEPIEKFKFDKQVGKFATPQSQACIYPESYHRQELERRLEYEESVFSAKLREEAEPEDYFEGGQVKNQSNSQETSWKTLPLFENINQSL
ncbi:DNA-methyltransferase [Spirulina subsalsa]|uniref:DNA-methyltransferase n=1 Tax=Spirulina subsalsa TaxID=54311 RepID=UPI0003159886|nr:site-specific DNA-methyltransferase [Spirulina subsalsa]